MILSRQAILLVTAVGVGLLTLCYVLGVQVGKQSAALRRPQARGAGEELEELPATMVDQLKALEQSGSGAGFEKPATPDAPANATTPVPTPSPAEGAAKPPAGKDTKEQTTKDPKAAKAPDAKAKPAPEAPAAKPGGPLWTAQIVSTPDAGEARAMAARARAAGFKTETVAEKGLYKVRVTPGLPRDAADATMTRLRNHGFKPFAVKVDR